ncbi:hypothetical protein [Erysipelothrix anatis]|uniref:hypothetical protein n=1 Tax=Erysipelothrix anatis TaxID=2683713 RepID=UPI00135ABECC|nr:hypothetical protein [Erysipelothrix anatis]
MNKIVGVLCCILIVTGCTQQSKQITTTCTDTSNPKFTQELVFITDTSGNLEGYKATISSEFETKTYLDDAVQSTKEREENYKQYSWIDFSYTTENMALVSRIAYDFKSVTPKAVKDAGFTGFVNGDKFSNIIEEKEIENINLRGAGFICVEK